MSTVIALAFKDLRLLLRDKIGFFFTFFFPIIYASFFGIIFSSNSDTVAMKIAIVDEDQTEGSRAFIKTLQDAPEVEVSLKNREGTAELTREDVARLVRRGRVVAYLILPKGFGEQSDQPFWHGPPQLETGIDPSRRAEAGMLQGTLTKYMFKNIQGMFTDREKMHQQVAKSLAALESADDADPIAKAALQVFLPSLDRFMATLPEGKSTFAGFQPVELKEVAVARGRGGPKNSFEISFPQGIIWGILGCACSFGISLVTERTKGTLVRLRMAPIGPMQILAGKAVACFITTSAVAVLLLGFAMIVFHVRPGSLFWLAVAIVTISVAFVGIMMSLSVLGKTEQSVAGVGWAIMMIMSMIGGGMIPLFAMPTWMQTLSHVSPIKWAIYAMEGAIWRGLSPSELLLPIAILLSVGVVFFIIGARVFSWSEQG